MVARFVAVALLVVVGGCSSSEYELAPVTGVVTLDDKPLPGGKIILQPIGGKSQNPGPGSAGTFDDQGRFELKTQTSPQEVGAVVGEHRVMIYSYSPETPLVQDTDPRPPKELVPRQYNYQSQLKITIPAAGRDDADFHLKTTGN